MERPRKKLSAIVLLALAAAIVAVSPSPLRVDLDLRGGDKGHALIRLGFATIRLAFDIGHRCSNPDNCRGAVL